MKPLLAIVVLLLTPAVSPAAIARVASASAGSADGGASVATSAISIHAGNLIVVGVSWYNTSPTVNDHLSSTFTARTVRANLTPTKCQIYYAVASADDAAYTVTASGVGTYPAIAVMAFSGVNATTPYDSESAGVAGNSSVTTITTGSNTPSEDNCLQIALLNTASGVGPFSADSSYTGLISTDWVNAQHEGVAMAYKIQTTAAADNVTFSWSGAGNCVASLTAFKSAPSSAKTSRLWYSSN